MGNKSTYEELERTAKWYNNLYSKILPKNKMANILELGCDAGHFVFKDRWKSKIVLYNNGLSNRITKFLFYIWFVFYINYNIRISILTPFSKKSTYYQFLIL